MFDIFSTRFLRYYIFLAPRLRVGAQTGALRPGTPERPPAFPRRAWEREGAILAPTLRVGVYAGALRPVYHLVVTGISPSSPA